METGTLYVVGTPIGNMEDITLRAIRLLSEVDFILCEDTRQTKKILEAYSISTPTISYHQKSSTKKEAEIINLLAEGKSLALVTDAGTPGISDPGSYLVAHIKKELPEVSVVSVPGPSALVSALSISGLPASDFLFLGFLPHKKGRETLFKEIRDSERTVVFYESPHRILKTLESLTEVLSPERVVVVARELTKVFEEVKMGTSVEVLDFFIAFPEKVRGEFVVMVRGE
jgi:16S rRNA (cytidine1402-2'-O)-methyltransferase